MGKLVYCPTCKAKMSDNATVCPVCGEYDFFKYVECDKSYYEVCQYCKGTGLRSMYRREELVLVLNNKIYFPSTSYDGEWVDDPWFNDVRKAISRNDYKIEMLTSPETESRFFLRLNRYYSRNARVHFNYEANFTCGACEGKGRFFFKKIENKKLDLREPVKSIDL